VIKVFLDANVIFSAAYSLSGGSAQIIELGKKGKLSVTSSRLAVKEAERNLREKGNEQQLDYFYRIFEDVDIDLVKVDRKAAKMEFGNLVGEKDAPILSAAIRSGAKFLVTLDKKHFLNKKVARANLPLNTVTPGKLIEKYLR